ncbi:unnamed protein product [Echinostoma caproni]|uniref:Vitellogenin domain-containing protein n=1 Tax=Echinostoma caproni TaxID=27848 RepID=A0A183A7M7_9TREM|nr:unnamed protein product [Echinostoma caproni]
MTAKSLEVPSYTTEVDISGECLTEYVPNKIGPSTIELVKRKYTAGCNRRFGYRTSLQLHSTQPPKRSQKIPFLDGSLVCVQLIETKAGVLNSTCEETVIIAQHSDTTDRTSLQVKTTLTRVEIEDGQWNDSDQADFTGATDLTFNFRGYQDGFRDVTGGDQSEFLQLLRKLQQKNCPRSMYKAIKQSRSFGSAEHSEIVKQVLTGSYGDVRKTYAEILIETGTVAAFDVLCLNRAELDLSLSDVLTALKNIETPTIKLLDSLDILLRDNPAALVPLPISEAVHKLCLQNSNCQNNAKLHSIVGNLLRPIEQTECVYNGNEEMNKIIVAFHALGNIGRFIDQSRISTIFSKCLSNSDLDVSVRVAAIELLRLTECDPQNEGVLRTYMSDPLVDVELRIMAYRSYMRCPEADKLEEMIQFLQNESSQQFGSYVLSHLTNLASITGPTAQPWAKYIGPFEKHIAQFRRRFRLNRRSFSKHYASFYHSKNIGLNIETSVIFGPESPIPRYVTVNLTLDMFDGQSNVLEFGIRSTEQRRIWTNLLKPTLTGLPASLDELEQKIDQDKADSMNETVHIRFRFNGHNCGLKDLILSMYA